MSKEDLKNKHSLKIIESDLKKSGLKYLLGMTDDRHMEEFRLYPEEIRDNKFAMMYATTIDQSTKLMNQLNKYLSNREKILKNYIMKNKNKKYIGMNK